MATRRRDRTDDASINEFPKVQSTRLNSTHKQDILYICNHSFNREHDHNTQPLLVFETYSYGSHHRGHKHRVRAGRERTRDHAQRQYQRHHQQRKVGVDLSRRSLCTTTRWRSSMATTTTRAALERNKGCNEVL